MWLILTEPFDPVGPWLHEGLTARTGQLFSLFTSHDIGRDARYEYGGGAGFEWFRLHTRDGSIIDSRTVRGVVNGLFSMPPGLSARMSPADRTAAIRNFNAPVMRWMHRFAGPVINRPNAQGICGDIRMPAEWAAVAESSGLPCLPHESEWASFSWLSPQMDQPAAPPLHRVVVIGETVLSLTNPDFALPAALTRACRRLAEAAHAPLLGIDLAQVDRETWCFVSAHKRPDLKPGGRPVIEAITIALGLGGSGAHRPPRSGRAARERDGTNDLVSALAYVLGPLGFAGRTRWRTA